MRTLANILWHVPFFGFLSALFHFLLGSLFVITVVGAPIGLGLIEYSKFLLAPFSYAMVSKDDLNIQQNEVWKAYSTIVWILYLPFGLLLCALAIFQIVFLFISILGIPVAVVVAKSLGTYLNPTNKKCVPYQVRDNVNFNKTMKNY